MEETGSPGQAKAVSPENVWTDHAVSCWSLWWECSLGWKYLEQGRFFCSGEYDHSCVNPFLRFPGFWTSFKNLYMCVVCAIGTKKEGEGLRDTEKFTPLRSRAEHV